MSEFSLDKLVARTFAFVKVWAIAVNNLERT